MSRRVPSQIDPELWIDAIGYPGRLFLLGNAHTYPGRMLAWSPEGECAAYVSKDEITESSDAARRWIDGFLSGNEPTPAAYLGIDDVTADDLDDDDPAWERWRTALVGFHRTGTLPLLVDIPTIPFAESQSFAHVPWMWAGGQVWRWQEGAWSVAHPSPALEDGFLVGSVCANRGYCHMDGADEQHVWCVDCGDTAEVSLPNVD